MTRRNWFCQQWRCPSMMPGMTIMPPISMTIASPSPAAAERSAPTASIRLPRISTSPSSKSPIAGIDRDHGRAFEQDAGVGSGSVEPGLDGGPLGRALLVVGARFVCLHHLHLRISSRRPSLADSRLMNGRSLLRGRCCQGLGLARAQRLAGTDLLGRGRLLRMPNPSAVRWGYRAAWPPAIRWTGPELVAARIGSAEAPSAALLSPSVLRRRRAPKSCRTDAFNVASRSASGASTEAGAVPPRMTISGSKRFSMLASATERARAAWSIHAAKDASSVTPRAAASCRCRRSALSERYSPRQPRLPQ